MKIWILAAAVTLASCASAPPTPETRGVQLMAQMKTAMGGAAWDRQSTFHSSGSAERGGQHVTYEVWGDMRAMKSVSLQTVGGPAFGGGYDGAVAWGQGPDGKVRSSTAPAALANARFGSYLTVKGYFFPDRFPAAIVYRGQQAANGHDYDVVEVTPPGAPFPLQLWLDPQTHVLKRISASNGAEGFVADTLRYETIDGVQIEFRIDHYDDGKLEAQTLEHFEFTPVPAERFSPPAS